MVGARPAASASRCSTCDQVRGVRAGRTIGDVVLVEQAQAGQVAAAGVGLGDGGGDLDQAGQGVLPAGADAHRVGGVHEQGAADRHLALELLGDEPVAAGRHLPGDGLGRVAGQVVAQVEQLAAGAGPAQAVDAGRRQQVVPLVGGGPAAGVGQHRQDAVLDDGRHERLEVEEALQVGQLQPQPLEADPARAPAADAVAQRQRASPRRPGRPPSVSPSSRTAAKGTRSATATCGSAQQAAEAQLDADVEGAAGPEGIDRAAVVVTTRADAQPTDDEAGADVEERGRRRRSTGPAPGRPAPAAASSANRPSASTSSETIRNHQPRVVSMLLPGIEHG